MSQDDRLVVPPRAVLWDMDGTLLDSAEHHWATWSEAFRGAGFDLTREQFDAAFGRRNDDWLRDYLGAAALEAVATVSNAKEELYRTFVRTHGVEPLPGVRRWLAELKKQDWRQVVASSAPKLNIEAVLAALDVDHYFEAIVASEDVARGKPEPDVFLMAAELVGVPPDRCVVVEDAPAGIEAAHRAGMRALGVGRSYAVLPAERVVATLDDLEPDAFDRLLRSSRPA